MRSWIAMMVLLLSAMEVSSQQPSTQRRATGAPSCVRDYRSNRLEADDYAQNTQALVTSVWQTMLGERIASASIVLVPCYYLNDKVVSLPIDGTRYIVYRPEWVQEVLSINQTEAVFIFGHEIGHFAANHFDDMSMSRPQKELEADELAGYYVARLGGSRQSVTSILRRVRLPAGNDVYPSRDESIRAAMVGYARGAQAGMRRNQLISAMRNQGTEIIRGVPPTRDPESNQAYRGIMEENERACREGGNNRITNMPPMCAAPSMSR